MDNEKLFLNYPFSVINYPLLKVFVTKTKFAVFYDFKAVILLLSK